MTDAARNPDDYCYRHPDRPSFVLCERCGRTICLECQNHVDGRVLCPDDARVIPITSHRPVRQRRARRRLTLPSWLEGHPVATYSILALGVLLFLVDLIARQMLMPYLWVIPVGPNSVIHQPWSLLTSMVSTNGVLSVLLGGYSIYSIGRWLESVLGWRRFLALYIASGLGAAIVCFLLDGVSSSWFGASMGLAGALIVLARRMHVNLTFLYITLGISVLFAIFLGGWQAVLGGLATGVGMGFIFYFEESPRQERRTRALVITIGAVLLVVAVLRAVIFPVQS
jgi:membrane associated rhomboid family serine protease